MLKENYTHGNLTSMEIEKSVEFGIINRYEPPTSIVTSPSEIGRCFEKEGFEKKGSVEEDLGVRLTFWFK